VPAVVVITSGPELAHAAAQAIAAREQLDAQAEEAAARLAEILVLEPHAAQQVDGEILAPGGDEHRVVALAPDVDGATEEVDIARMREVDKDPHEQSGAGQPTSRGP
jgi:hypothetical protein